MYVWVIYIAIKFYHHFKIFMFSRKFKTVKRSSFPVALVIAAEFYWLKSWCQWLSVIQSQTRPCADSLTLQNPGAGVLTIPHREQFNVLTFFCCVFKKNFLPWIFKTLKTCKHDLHNRKKCVPTLYNVVMQVSNICGFVVSIKTIFLLCLWKYQVLATFYY